MCLTIYLASSTPARKELEHNVSIGSSSTKRKLQLQVEDKIEKSESNSILQLQ